LVNTFSRRSFIARLSGATGAALMRTNALSTSGYATDQEGLLTKLAADPLRPQFHLLPAANWMNDPNGPIYYRGQYHMFHQYNPHAAVWGDMHWAHATSPDLVHWHHEPIAIAPTPDGYDRYGVFSGSAVLDHGTPTVIYTGVMPPGNDAEATLRDGAHVWREVQCLAVSHDNDLRAWEKLPEPVIAYPPDGLQVTGFRDPCLWREGNEWMLILGSGIRGKGPVILLYRSTDLRHWTYLHPLIERSIGGKTATNPVDKGDMWECPDFFPLGGKHVLLVSTMGKVHWKVGEYRDHRFVPETEGLVDAGAYYAAKSMVDHQGRRILWGWIPEMRPVEEHRAAGWAGAMALPRVLALNRTNELEMTVHPALEVLRGSHSGVGKSMGEVALKQSLADMRIENLAAELNAEVLPRDGTGATLTLRSNEGKAVVTVRCAFHRGSGELQVNGATVHLSAPVNQPVQFRLFLDGSVLEVFVNRTTVMTVRVYDLPAGPLRIDFTEISAMLSLDLWPIQPISKNRLTT
jgi:beta-fructofuranosidase